MDPVGLDRASAGLTFLLCELLNALPYHSLGSSQIHPCIPSTLPLPGTELGAEDSLCALDVF